MCPPWRLADALSPANKAKQPLLPSAPFIVCDASHSRTAMAAPNGIPAFEGPEDVLRRRPVAAAPQGPLETSPIPTATRTGTRIPNTPLAASAISFILGGLFIAGISLALTGPYSYWWSTRQLGFFCAAWAAFHWGEFAVTAGWNREKCSVDCEYQFPRRMQRL